MKPITYIIFLAIIGCYLNTENSYKSERISKIQNLGQQEKVELSCYDIKPLVDDKKSNSRRKEFRRALENGTRKKKGKKIAFRRDDANTKEPLNIEWVGYGYDIFKGNPYDLNSTSFKDPGISMTKIFEITYDKKQLSTDGKVKIPDGFNYHELSSCTVNLSTSTWQSVEDLNYDIEAKLKVDYNSIFDNTFGMNAGYISIGNEITSRERVYVRNNASCAIYYVTIQKGLPPKFNEGFLNQIKNLADKRYSDTPTPFYEFIERVGTHYPENTIFGSQFIYISSIDKQGVLSIKSQGGDIELSVKFQMLKSLSKTSGSFKAEMSEDGVVTKETTISESKKYFLGAQYLGPDNDKVAQWLLNTKSKAMPIGFELTELNRMLNQEKCSLNLGDKTENFISDINEAYANYCKKYLKEKKGFSCSKASPVQEIEKSTDSYEGNNIYSLLHQDIKCDKNSALSYFKLNVNSDGTINFNYKCQQTKKITKKCKVYFTPLNETADDKTQSINYLDRHDIRCPEKTLLQKFRFQDDENSKSKNFHFKYICCDADYYDCEELKTETTSQGNTDFNAYSLITVEAAKSNAFQRIQMISEGGKFSYAYTACSLAKRKSDK